MQSFFDLQYGWEFAETLIETLSAWMAAHLFNSEGLFQLAIQLALLLAARLIGTLLGMGLRPVARKAKARIAIQNRHLMQFIDRLIGLLPLLTSIFLLWAGIIGLHRVGFSTFLLSLVLNLSMAWVVVQLLTSVILERFWSRLIAVSAWSLAALNIVGLLDDTISMLERVGFTVGDVRLSVLSIVKAVVVFTVLLRLGNGITRWAEKKLMTVPELSPSSQLMIAKGMHVSLIFLVSLIALNSIGVNLTALAVFSGAVGVGVGFGLQKVVGNYVSGLILLSDKSVKPGDVVQLGDVYGWIKQMGGRCVSVITRDEKEYLIPNEDLITQQVINWSYSSRKIRIKVPVGISYQADPHQVIKLILGAVDGLERIIDDPPPKCLLIGFGDNSVDLQLRFWIEDPQNGVANITSRVLLRIWDILKQHHIEIPFPQRDVHLDLPSELKVRTVSAADEAT